MLIELERRRTPRHPFGGVAEVTALGSGKYFVALTKELGRFGCFVKTTTPCPAGESVTLRITHGGREFVVSGKVVYVANEGMGIAFGPIPVGDQAVLEDWLAAITV